MLSYCLKCKRNTENTNLKVLKTSNGETMILSKCAICGAKKSNFMKDLKNLEELLSSLGFEAGLDKIPFFGVYLL